MQTITLTDEQFKALQSGQAITIEPPKPVITKWEPRYEIGSYFIDFSHESIGCVSHHFNSYYGKRLAKSGFMYKTKAQAEAATKQLSSYSRQLAWLSENDDGWVADWSDAIHQGKYWIEYDYHAKKCIIDCTSCYRSLNNIYMSKTNAKKLCELLNDGIVEF